MVCHPRCDIYNVKQGSTNIVNFIKTRADVLVLGFGLMVIQWICILWPMGRGCLVLDHGHIGHIVFNFLEMIIKLGRVNENCKIQDPRAVVLVLGCGQFVHGNYQTKLQSLWSRLIWDSQSMMYNFCCSGVLYSLLASFYSIGMVWIQLGISWLQSNK